MVSVKALWAHSAIGLPTTLKNLLVPPLIAPESMTAIQLLEQFKKTGRHTAVISDEFGAVQGLVTLIDVFEAIVGDLPEPGQRNQTRIKRREDGSWLVDATLPIAEFKSAPRYYRESLPTRPRPNTGRRGASFSPSLGASRRG
jgi:putative hemolysin